MLCRMRTDSFAEGSLLPSLVAVTAWFAAVWVSVSVAFAITLEVQMQAHVEICMGMVAGLVETWWSLNRASDGI